MIRKSLVALALCTTLSFSTRAQNGYWMSAGEMIFSYGSVDAPSAVDITPIVRWSPVFNFQGQYHYDFSKSVGIYTGLGIRNVGLISRIDFVDSSDVGATPIQKEARVKERSYSLGLPLALKLGDVDNGTHFTIGAEAELMFVYKRKIFVDDGKFKTYEWFSDNVNIFNPSAFAEVNFKHGVYIRFKYYLMDFLNYEGIEISGMNIKDYGQKSPLFYVSIGSADLVGDWDDEFTSKPQSTSAFFKTKKKDWKQMDATAQVY
ncbi:MAG: hypothetical protein K1X63_16240 [Chitinophagales bacterium]|nr:hypothetical protein [Chitinophagales bacterium]